MWFQKNKSFPNRQKTQTKMAIGKSTVVFDRSPSLPRLELGLCPVTPILPGHYFLIFSSHPSGGLPGSLMVFLFWRILLIVDLQNVTPALKICFPQIWRDYIKNIKYVLKKCNLIWNKPRGWTYWIFLLGICPYIDRNKYVDIIKQKPNEFTRPSCHILTSSFETSWRNLIV